MSDSKPPAKKRKGRSPSYPGLNLEEAIGKARIIHQHEKHHPAPIEAILGHWSYTPKSGTGLVAVAALKKFGLLDDEGSGASRKARLTDRALDILLDPRKDSPNRQRAIREAALEPTIHEELFNKYEGRLPSDSSLRFHLVRERGFTESGAAEFISEIRATFTFAKVSGTDSMSPKVEDDAPPEADDLAEDDGIMAAEIQNPSSEEVKDFQFSITLYGGRLATVKAPVPMTKRNLERLKRMIEDQLEPFVSGDDPEAA